MAEPPDLEELARRYMDLWEEQLAAVAGDRTLADQMARLFGAMKQGGIFPAGGEEEAAETDEAADDGKGQPIRKPSGTATLGTEPGTEPGAAAGTTALGAASERGDRDLAEFARRLAIVEERLAALESKAGGKSRKAAPRSGAKRG